MDLSKILNEVVDEITAADEEEEKHPEGCKCDECKKKEESSKEDKKEKKKKKKEKKFEDEKKDEGSDQEEKESEDSDEEKKPESNTDSILKQVVPSSFSAGAGALALRNKIRESQMG